LSAPENAKEYIAQQLTLLMQDNNFEYAVQGASRGDAEREALIFERLEKIARYSY
jgi:hypothetical protein